MGRESLCILALPCISEFRIFEDSGGLKVVGRWVVDSSNLLSWARRLVWVHAGPAYVIRLRIHIETPGAWRYLNGRRPLPQPPELAVAQAPSLGNHLLPGEPTVHFVSALSTSTAFNQSHHHHRRPHSINQHRTRSCRRRLDVISRYLLRQHR